MDEYITKEQVIDWFRPYGHLDRPIPFETLVSDLRGMKAADVEPVQEWISAKDRLPEKKGAFLVYVKTKNKWCGYIKTTWFTPCYEGVEDHMQGKQVWYDYDSDQGDYEVRDVTHWMPLPEPPKGE